MMNMHLQCEFHGILQKMAFEYDGTLETSARFREWAAATDKQHVWKHSNVLRVQNRVTKIQKSTYESSFQAGVMNGPISF